MAREHSLAGLFETAELRSALRLVACSFDEPNFSLAVASQRVGSHANVTKPEQLGSFMYGVGRKFEQLSIAEIAEFRGTPRIVTFRNHETE